MSHEGTEPITETFRVEAAELLVELEAVLLEMETRLDEPELVARVFRALHTIKGSGAMFGFDTIVSVAHALESAFDGVRGGRRAATRELVALALQGKDLIQLLLAAPTGDDPALAAAVRAVIEHARASSVESAPAPGVVPAERATPAPPAPATRVYRVRFRPHPGLLLDGTNPYGIWAELKTLGRCEVVAHTTAIPSIRSLDPEHCFVAWDAIIATDRGENAIRDLFIFVEDRGDLKIELIDDGRSTSEDADYKKLGEILVERGDVTAAQIKEVLASRPRIGELLEQKGLVSTAVTEAAALEQRVVRDVRAARGEAKPPPETTNVRVAAEKLDGLVDLVGEIVIAQARLSALTAQRDDPELCAVAETIDRLAAELRDNALNLRMVPIGTTFSRFKRLVRDLSADLGKRIELVTDGAETELDKTVIERLGDPLVHLIRNSCDHGIEAPDARERAGKAPVGVVRLAAYQAGPNVVIEISDDGKGMDAQAIRQHALARGLVERDAELSPQEMLQLIFLPGLSTAAKVSNVSGRGVGMDVVKRSVEALRGAIEIESAVGRGSTIRIRLPLTLAIIDGLLVAVGEGRYVLPMSLVEECVEITRDDVERAHGSHVAPVRGELVPYLRLREWFGEHGSEPAIEQIAIASAEGLRFGFVVDDVIGQHQTVVKALGRMYRDVQGLSGATILGDGTVALIVDVAGVMRTALHAHATQSS